MHSRFYLTLIVALMIASSCVDADDAAQAKETKVPIEKGDTKPEANWNLATKTTGGAQLWTDHLHRGGDRLQQNAVTGHWRLLDSNNVRRTWGTRQQCEAVLDERNPKPEEVGQSEHVVVLLHGLMRTRACMTPLEHRLKEDGYPHSIRFAYASTQFSIADHAAALRETLEDYPKNTTFSFVGHSMGNIVVRYLVGELQREGDEKKLLSRCKSMVMLGPPNQGAAISRALAPTGLYGLVVGKGGLELGPEWNSFVDKLATPPFPFAIIAGDVSRSLVQNPLVKGSSDFVVSLEEADLEGREWLKTVPVLHSYLMDDLVTMSMTTEFIQSHQE
jgi:pimeloyl-ACP methyl ester carboxylesterase